MSKFEFKLENVLRHRQDTLYKLQMEYFNLEKEYLNQNEIINSLYESRNKYLEIRYNCSVSYRKLANYNLDFIEKQLIEEKDKLNVLKTKLKEKREELLKVNINVKTLSILKNRKKEKFDKQEELKEQKQLDEFYTCKYGKRVSI